MNRLILTGLLISSIVIAGTLSMTPLVQAGWFDKTNEPNQKVWQESCNPAILLNTGETCQQANFIIKQNAQIHQDLQDLLKK